VKGILGKKLGMTQIFDPESGVLTPVTVIEAGPCPVVQVRTNEIDGYEAVQLAFDEVPDRKISKPELGHLRKGQTGAHRRLVEFRGPSELLVGESVTVEAFEPGDNVKVAAVAHGKGFQGTIKRHNFARGRTARTTSASPARSVRRRPRRAFSRASRWRAAWAASASRSSAS
jgi:large subunit ribosomal protein L3